jgi:protein-tyrosine-phosphatase
MKIHFVSYGHAFRSRLAEAYTKYVLRKYKNIEITSSGIVLEDALNGPIAWYAMKILSQHALVPYMSLEPVKTTKEMIEKADKVVFMDRHSYEYCQKKFRYHCRTCEVWELDYIMPDKVERGRDLEYDIRIVEKSEQIFDQIKNNCSRMYSDFSVTDVPFEK